MTPKFLESRQVWKRGNELRIADNRYLLVTSTNISRKCIELSCKSPAVYIEYSVDRSGYNNNEFAIIMQGLGCTRGYWYYPAKSEASFTSEFRCWYEDGNLLATYSAGSDPIMLKTRYSKDPQ